MYIISSKLSISDDDQKQFNKVVSSLTIPRSGQLRKQIVQRHGHLKRTFLEQDNQFQYLDMINPEDFENETGEQITHKNISLHGNDQISYEKNEEDERRE